MNADCVAVGIENHRHAANRSDERLGTKPDLVGAKVFNGLDEVFHLQGLLDRSLWLTSVRNVR